jgi:hypothetical protein
MEKQDACAAASSSSGLVRPLWCSVRDAHVTGSRANAPLELLERLDRDGDARAAPLVAPNAVDVAFDAQHRREPALRSVDARLQRRVGQQPLGVPRRGDDVLVEGGQQADRLDRLERSLGHVRRQPGSPAVEVDRLGADPLEYPLRLRGRRAAPPAGDVLRRYGSVRRDVALE